MAATTFHQQLLQIVSDQLNALPSVYAGNVHIERADAFDRDECPGINLVLGDARLDSIGSDGQWDLVRADVAVLLKLHTRGDPHTQLADPAIGDANAALMTDPSLGGYALRLRLVATRKQQAPADGTAGIYELEYRVTVTVNEATLALMPA